MIVMTVPGLVTAPYVVSGSITIPHPMATSAILLQPSVLTEEGEWVFIGEPEIIEERYEEERA